MQSDPHQFPYVGSREHQALQVPSLPEVVCAILRIEASHQRTQQSQVYLRFMRFGILRKANAEKAHAEVLERHRRVEAAERIEWIGKGKVQVLRRWL